MRKKLLFTIVLISGFLFTAGVKTSFSDVLSEFSDWIGKMESLADRVGGIEKDVDSIRGMLESFKDKEDSINKIVGRLEALEASDSTTQTLSVLKEGLAEVRKLIEDQQVITAVLEKRYKEAEQPLEPIKKSIDEQKKAIDSIVAKLDAQSKNHETINENIDKKMASLEALTKNIDEKMAQLTKFTDAVNKIEQKGGSLEKVLAANIGTLPKKAIPGAGAGAKATEKAKPVEAEKKKKKEFSIADVLQAQGFMDIGSNFFVKDISFNSFGSSVEVSGKLMNATDKNYNVANIRIFVYDGSNQLIRNQDFSVKGIRKGNVMPFSEIISGVRESTIKKYAIAFGKEVQAYQITDLLDKPVAGVVATNEAAKEKPKAGDVKSAMEKEGYTDIGNNFYVKNLHVKKFGSSCEIMGEVKNAEQEYCSVALFKVIIKDNAKTVIWEQDFSIKGINPGAMKPFSEFLTGVSMENIDSYEIKSKKRGTR